MYNGNNECWCGPKWKKMFIEGQRADVAHSWLNPKEDWFNTLPSFELLSKQLKSDYRKR